MYFRRLSYLLLTMAAPALLAGCGSAKLTPPKTVPVSGSVTRDGKPVVGARVKFHPQFKIAKLPFVPYGETGTDGQFVLSTGMSGNGAPKGKYLVSLELPYIGIDPKDGLEAELDKLKGEYRDPAKNNWEVTLKDGDNVVEPFQIK